MGAPGQFLGIYGSVQFPGGSTMEYRNELICRAFGDKEKDLAEQEIQNFFFSTPEGKKRFETGVKWPRGKSIVSGSKGCGFESHD